jgi:hypothetical protein
MPAGHAVLMEVQGLKADLAKDLAKVQVRVHAAAVAALAAGCLGLVRQRGSTSCALRVCIIITIPGRNSYLLS